MQLIGGKYFFHSMIHYDTKVKLELDCFCLLLLMLDLKKLVYGSLHENTLNVFCFVLKTYEFRVKTT